MKRAWKAFNRPAFSWHELFWMAFVSGVIDAVIYR